MQEVTHSPDSNDIPIDNEPRPYCIVYKGETISLSDMKCKVERFDKKSLALSTDQDLTILMLERGNTINIKNSVLEIVSVGPNWINLRARAGTHIFDQAKIDKLRKQSVKRTKNELLNN